MMLSLQIGRPEAAPARVLAIGAHPNDIEIGCAGTLLKLTEQEAILEVRRVVLSGSGERTEELLDGVPTGDVVVCDSSDGFFPYEGQRIKDYFERLTADFSSRSSRLTSRRTWSSRTSARTCTKITVSAAS
jgi:hypothetical protein